MLFSGIITLPASTFWADILRSGLRLLTTRPEAFAI
jgi:hypothetical protein